jgi:hypothetical protein
MRGKGLIKRMILSWSCQFFLDVPFGVSPTEKVLSHASSHCRSVIFRCNASS